MKTAVIIFLSIVFCVPVFADWESTGPDGGPIEYVVQSKQDPDVLYANSGMCKFARSEDGGLTWTRVGDYSSYSYSLGIGPTDILFSGGIFTVYISTDGAESWNSSYVSGSYFQDIAPHPTDSSIIHATGFKYESSIYYMQYIYSDDCGATWNTSDLASDAKGSTIAFSASSPDILYLGGYNPVSWGPMLYKSTDGGSNWSDITPAEWSSDYQTYSIAVHPSDPNIVVVSNRSYMYRSDDGGSSWTQVVGSATIYDLAWSGADSNVLYGGAGNYVYCSTDGGVTWNYSVMPEGGNYETIAASSVAAGTAWVGHDSGLYMTTDGGTSWTTAIEGMNFGTVAALESAFSNPSRMYLSVEDVGIFLTDDSGGNWTKLDTLLDCGDICSFAVSRTDPDYVYALEGAG